MKKKNKKCAGRPRVEIKRKSLTCTLSPDVIAYLKSNRRPCSRQIEDAVIGFYGLNGDNCEFD